MLAALREQSGLTLIEAPVEGLLFDDVKISGVILADGTQITAKAVVLTSGTFLNGVMFVGHETSVGGRIGDVTCTGITPYLKQKGLNVGRLKTGTPARLNGKTIHWEKLSSQDGDNPPQPFSYLTEKLPIRRYSVLLLIPMKTRIGLFAIIFPNVLCFPV